MSTQLMLSGYSAEHLHPMISACEATECVLASLDFRSTEPTATARPVAARHHFPCGPKHPFAIQMHA